MRRLACLTLVALLAMPSVAATFVVDDPATTGDATPGDGACATAAGSCTLVAAIEEANALPGLDEIVAAAGTLPASVSRDVSDDLRISGPGTLSAVPVPAPAEPPAVLAVPPGVTLELSGLALEGVRAEASGTVVVSNCALGSPEYDGRSLRVLAQGIGVVDGGTLDLSSIVVEANGRLTSNGASLRPGPTPYGGPRAPIVTSGDTTIRRLRGSMSGDTYNGNALLAAISQQGGDLLVEDASLQLAYAGALRVESGRATLRRCVLAGSNAQAVGGLTTRPGPLIECSGGSLAMAWCEIHGNLGGGIRIGSAGTGTLDRCSIEGLLGASVTSDGALTIRDSWLRSNNPECVNDCWSGTGGLHVRAGTALVQRTEISANSAIEGCTLRGRLFGGVGRGGGLLLDGGSARLEDCKIGTCGVWGGDDAMGGGIMVAGGTLRLERCLVASNTVLGSGGGLAIQSGIVDVVNSTLSGNFALHFFQQDLGVDVGGAGGAAWTAGGDLRLRSVTIASNTADRGAGGVDATAGGVVRVADAILADGGSDCGGDIVSEGYVLVESAAACNIAGDLTGVVTGVDPALVPLASDGGALPTHALAPGSRARDAADPAGNRDGLGGVLAVDQRSRARIIDGDGDGTARGDLGAHEACEDAVDSDADGLGDACDPCPMDPAPQADADHDGIGDACDDGDADGDGIIDRDDACPAVADPAQDDADGDGIGDACDACPLVADDRADADGDAVPDACDACVLAFDPAQADGDGDAVGDTCDDCPDVADAAQADGDGDGIGDACDACPLVSDDGTDSDSDGIGDACDNCGSAPNPQQQDADGDGLGDACDSCPTQPGIDPDGDGICGADDNCPGVANVAQEDTDGDGTGDACDPCPLVVDSGADADSDGIGDACDDCPAIYDPAQQDADGDGIGDACDAQPDCGEPRNLRVTKTPGALLLYWDTVATGGVSEIYRGDVATLRSGYATTPAACAVAGNGRMLLSPATDSYFLVAARCGAERSALGHDSFGAAIPAPATACP